MAVQAIMDPKALDVAFMERFSPGQRAHVFVGIPWALTREELATFRANIQAAGVNIQAVEQGGADEWPVALRLTVQRPPRARGFAILPLAVPIIAALAALGITAWLGFKLGGVVDSIKNNIIPLALIGAGALVLIAVAGSRG